MRHSPTMLEQIEELQARMDRLDTYLGVNSRQDGFITEDGGGVVQKVLEIRQLLKDIWPEDGK